MRVVFTLVLLTISLLSYGQDIRWAVANGLWSSTSTWSDQKGGAPGFSIPDAGDIVYTDGFQVSVNQNVTVEHLLIRDAGLNQLRYGGLFAPFTITITNTLQGVNSIGDAGSAPTETVIQNSPGLIFRFTSTNSLGAIRNWSYLAPLNTVEIAPTGGGTVITDSESGFLSISGSITILSGIFRPGRNIADAFGNAFFIVNSGATLSLHGQGASVTGDGTLSTSFNEIQISGTVNISPDRYLNTNVFMMASSGVLNCTNANPTGQTEGWWYQSNRPNTFSIASSSSINYNASGSQNVYATNYSNISLLGLGTKSVVGGSSFTVTGDLTVSTGVTLNTTGAVGISLLGDVVNNGSWSPVQLVRFEGTGTQVVSGNPITFAGGINIGNASPSPSTILDLQDNLDINGNLRIFPNATLDTNEEDVFLSGNLTNDGSITFGNPDLSSITFDGTTTFGGVPSTLPSVIITGILNAPPSMLVAGNFSNNGTFNASTGTVTFNGTTDQSISGVTTFNNVTISNTSTLTGVTPTSTMNLRGTLTMSTAANRFNANGNLVVQSTGVNSGGRIATLPSTTNFTGNVTIQRFVDGPDDWRYLSIPKQTSSVEDLRDPVTFPITGNFSNPSPPDADVVAARAPSLYRWNANTQAWVALGSGGTMAATPTTNVGLAAYSYRTGDVTLSYSGAPNKGSVNVSLGTAGEGWNLVPNPYPSAIDWDNVDRTGLADEMEIRTANMVFAYYIGGLVTNAPFSGWTGEVAIGQSFWIRSTGGTTLTFKEADKTGNQYEFLREKEAENYFRMTLASQTQQDEAVVYFAEGATDAYDAKFDAGKRRNGCETCDESGYLNFSTFTTDPDRDFAINGIARIDCNRSVGIRVRDITPGSYTIKFTELDKLYLGYSIKLIDHFASNETIVEEGTEYEFNVTEDVSSYGSGRFEIEISTAQINTSEPLSFTDLKDCNDENVKVSLNAPQKGVNYQLWSGSDPVSELVTSNGSDITFVLSREAMEQGSNLFTVKTATVDGCYSHDFNDALAYYLDAPPLVASVTNGENCGEGMVTLGVSGASSGGYYNWYEAVDATEPIFSSEATSYTTPSLTKSKTYFVSVVNASGCESQKSQVDASIIYEDAPTIEVQGNTLISTEGSTYQWFKNGEEIAGQTNRELHAMESGDYSVNVTLSNGCDVSSETLSFLITGERDLVDMGIRVYPNPTNGLLRIVLPDNFVNSVSEVGIYDGRGSEIFRLAEIDKEIDIDLRQKRSGSYILNIVSSKRVIALRLVKK